MTDVWERNELVISPQLEDTAAVNELHWRGESVDVEFIDNIISITDDILDGIMEA